MSINKTYAVLGLGRYGRAVAEELVNNGAEVLAVDIDQNNVNNAIETIPVCKCADITEPEAIKRLGISNIDVVIVAMASNLEASVMAVMLCKDAGVKEIIVKCGSEMHSRIFESMGASRVIFPENESGKRLAKNLLSSGFIDVASLSDDISIVEILPPKKWLGKTLRELDIRKTYSLNVIAVIKSGITELVSDPDMMLDEETKLVIIAKKADIEKIR
jgi:trk system potassium uptake protein TrkA